MIEVRSLSLNRGAKTLLDDINLSISKNGVHAILGANGAGKTTLLKSLIFADFTKGEVKINSKDIHSIPFDQRSNLITYAGETEFSFSTLTVLEIIDYSRFGSRHDLDFKKQLIAEFELESLLERQVRSLSGGEKQRLNLLCSLYQGCDYVLWDEPTNYLDPRHIDLLESVIARYSSKVSFVIVAHDLNFLMEVAHKIYALKSGKLLFEDSKDEVFSKRKLDLVFDKEFLYIEDSTKKIIR